MGLGLNKNPQKGKNGKWSIFGRGTNTSNPNNLSHHAEIPTNFTLAPISFEDIDQSVYQEFNKRFRINEDDMALFSGDAETVSMINQNYESFDNEKLFLNWPFFVYTRTESKKMFRTNPAYKQVLFAVPKLKAQGIVIEEYIATGPVNYEFIYDFKFITYFREEANHMEEQVNYYFRNKRSVIECCSERFSVGPVTPDQICSLEMVSRDDAAQITMYVLSFKLKLWCWTRTVADSMKRERPNSYSFTFTVKDGRPGEETTRITSTEGINIEQYVVEDKPKPNELIDPT